MELAADAFFQNLPDGTLIRASIKTAEITGYATGELINLNVRHLLTPATTDQLPLFDSETEPGVQFVSDAFLHCKDNQIIRIELSAIKAEDGSWFCFCRNISGKLTIEKALAESERQYKKLLHSMLDGFVYVNMEGYIIDSNQAYQDMLGYTPDELSKLTYRDITPERWHEPEHDIVSNRILPEGYSPVYQKEYIRKDGSVFPVELRTSLVRDENGRQIGMWAMLRDITNRKRYEEKLILSEEKFRNIVESSPTAMYFYTINNNNELILTGANPSADRIIGINHKQLVGLTIQQAFPNLQNTSIPELYLKVGFGEIGPQSFEVSYSDSRFNGHYFVHVFRTSPKTITVDFIDISDRKMMEEAIRRSEIEYRDTLDALPEWIYVIDNKFRFLIINASMQEAIAQTGFTFDLVGTNVPSDHPFFPEEDLKLVRNVFISGIPEFYEKKISHLPDDRHVQVTMLPFRKDDQVEKVVIVIKDRSREKEIEELKQRSADQKEVLLREIHHRVKNNLSIVISLLSFQMNDNPNPELRVTLVDIQTRIRAMALIHEHLYRSENLDKIPLANYINSLAHMVSSTFSGHRIEFVNDLEPIEVSIETALPIGLIINELLTNAFKYAFPESQTGLIRMELKNIDNDLFQFSFCDNGVGLPKDFSPESNTSLGLYIVRLLIEQLDGTLKIVNEQGTTFIVTFRNIFRKR
jgi:PAS domain S-box-containing protein